MRLPPGQAPSPPIVIHLLLSGVLTKGLWSGPFDCQTCFGYFVAEIQVARQLADFGRSTDLEAGTTGQHDASDVLGDSLRIAAVWTSRN